MVHAKTPFNPMRSVDEKDSKRCTLSMRLLGCRQTEDQSAKWQENICAYLLGFCLLSRLRFFESLESFRSCCGTPGWPNGAGDASRIRLLCWGAWSSMPSPG